MRLYRKTTQTTAYHELATVKRSSHEQARTLVCVIYSQRVCARVCVRISLEFNGANECRCTESIDEGYNSYSLSSTYTERICGPYIKDVLY